MHVRADLFFCSKGCDVWAEFALVIKDHPLTEPNCTIAQEMKTFRGTVLVQLMRNGLFEGPSSISVVKPLSVISNPCWDNRGHHIESMTFSDADSTWIAGVDGCRGGWIAFKVELSTMHTSIGLVDISALLRGRPSDLAAIAIDVPIGLLDGSRACDKAARKLLGQPRGTSVFPAPCRSSLSGANHANAAAINKRITGRALSRQAWSIVPKIKQVDDVITPTCQEWVFEVHPEISFWALAGGTPMTQSKREEGVSWQG